LGRINNNMNRLILASFVAAALLTPAANAQHLSVGVALGTPFTGGISDATSTAVDTITHTFSNSNEYLVGPMVEVHLPLNLSIEADALYRPINVTTDFQIVPNPAQRTSSTYSTWEFPVLGKYRLPLLPIVKPFVEAGPSFRASSSSLSFLSNHGFTIGGGLEVKILRLRIAPAIRYTHWGPGSQNGVIIFNPGSGTAATILPGNPSNQNQGEFLVGFSF
jgi:hypothetical protein